MKFVFFGTADFGCPALRGVIEAGHELKAVVTKPPRRRGRGRKEVPTPLDRFVQDYAPQVPVFRPDSLQDPSFIATLEKIEADVFVVVAFTILPEAVFSIPPRGTFNIHAALLPQFRGPAPIHRAVEEGAEKTGITVFRIDRGIDTGSILLQKETALEPSDTTPRLYDRLSRLGAEALVEAFALIDAGRDEYRRQDHRMATKAPLLKKSEGRISWNESAQAIERKIRAFRPFPGTFTEINDTTVVITAASAEKTSAHAAPGTILRAHKKDLHIACGEGVLKVERLKPAGKREMDVSAYLNGAQLEEGYRIT
ncbi:MAG: methionyl-tRNA formyltransferase [Fibrobacterota bacterium]